MNDIFQPRREPARSLYEAFQAAAATRKEKSVDRWCADERAAVAAEARRQSAQLGLRCPTAAEVEEAELSARGYIDYGAQWAYRLAEAMRLPRPLLAGGSDVG